MMFKILHGNSLKTMKNLPKKIYLDIGFPPREGIDFNDLNEVTWSKDNATGNGIRYVHESQLKERDNLISEINKVVNDTNLTVKFKMVALKQLLKLNKMKAEEFLKI